MAVPVLSDRRARIQSAPVRHVDLVLLGATLAVSALGLLMIYSSTRPRTKTSGISPYYFVERQGIAIMVGLLVMAAVMAIDYRKMRDIAPLFYLGTIGLLLAVLSPFGSTSKGTQAWFQLPGGFQFQPSEFAKFGLIIAVAGYCYQHRGDLDLRRLAVTVGLAGVPLALVVMQPDLGTAMVMGLVVLAILAVAGVKGRHLAVLFVLAVVGVVGVVNLGMLKQYQVDRLTGFLDQSNDTSRSTYNLNQSKTAIGNGGFLGRGYLNGSQTNLSFVPEQHTDFIFTVVGEELGFVGGATLLALFAIIVWRTWRSALLSSDFFGTLACVGIAAIFAFQVFENVGMTMGIMPITGIPLPFVSYGGSATIAYFACIGLVLNVHMRRFS